MELTANQNITQTVEVVTDFEKRNKLLKHLELISNESGKVLIFVATKRVADDITKYLRQDGWPALAIHGDKEQRERDWVLAEFKSGRSPILIATDVASRGLGMYFSSCFRELALGLDWDEWPSQVCVLLNVFFPSCRSRSDMVCAFPDPTETTRAVGAVDRF